MAGTRACISFSLHLCYLNKHSSLVHCKTCICVHPSGSMTPILFFIGTEKLAMLPSLGNRVSSKIFELEVYRNEV